MLLDVIVITKNEGDNLKRLFGSLKFLKVPFRVIVFDSFSDDDTIEISRRMGAEVFLSPWKGYSYQREKALKYSENPWVLFLDADEELTAEIGEEISRVISEDKADGFYIKRKNYYMGKLQRSKPTKVLRLAKRDKIKITKVPVHEKLEVDGKVLTLKNPILHHQYKNVTHHWWKNIKYAELFSQTNKRANFFDIALRFPLNFLKYYILNLGILDGFEGLIFSLSQAWYHTQKYILLYEKGKGN